MPTQRTGAKGTEFDVSVVRQLTELNTTVDHRNTDVETVDNETVDSDSANMTTSSKEPNTKVREHI